MQHLRTGLPQLPAWLRELNNDQERSKRFQVVQYMHKNIERRQGMFLTYLAICLLGLLGLFVC